MLSCRLTSGPLLLRIYLFLWWFLLALFWLFVLHWRYELPCQDKLPEFHYTPILGCIRVFWLVFHPLGLELDKALFGWNSVRGGAIGGVGGGSSTNDYNNDNNDEANDYGNNNDDTNDDAKNNNDDDNNNNDANDILGGGGGMDGIEAELEQMIEGKAGNPSNHSSSITIHSVRDSVVAPHTLKTYCTEILKFLNWCRENKPNLLQSGALLWLDEIQTRAHNEHVRAFKARVQEALKILL